MRVAERNRLVETELGGLGLDDFRRRPRVALLEVLEWMEQRGREPERQERRKRQQHDVVEQPAREKARHPVGPAVGCMRTGYEMGPWSTGCCSPGVASQFAGSADFAGERRGGGHLGFSHPGVSGDSADALIEDADALAGLGVTMLT